MFKETKDTYQAYVMCGNCNYSGNIFIPKGRTVVGSSCPNCGCHDLRLKPQPKWTSEKKAALNLDGTWSKVNKLFDDVGKGLDDIGKSLDDIFKK